MSSPNDYVRLRSHLSLQKLLPVMEVGKWKIPTASQQSHKATQISPISQGQFSSHCLRVLVPLPAVVLSI